MKRMICAISLSVLFSVPILSQAIDTIPMVRVTNESNSQYDDASLDTFTDIKFY